MSVTKRRMLEDILGQAAEDKRRWSRNRTGVSPMPGYEIPFTEAEERCEKAREMIRELERREELDALAEFARINEAAIRNPDVRKKIHEWQLQIMKGERPNLDDLKLDGGNEDVPSL